MTRVTGELIAASSTTKRLKTESLEQFLARITHANLSAKGVEQIENFRPCKSLSVLYLYENAIESMQNIACLTQLTHLYLHDNRIAKIEGLAPLTKLTKLYLNNNAIAHVEGLETLMQLKELHLQNQRIPAQLTFAPSVVRALAGNLRILNVSGTNLESLEPLVGLASLQTLVVANNKLAVIEEVCLHVSQMKRLSTLDLRVNPVCELTKYRERIILASESLAVLDDKKVADNERRFLVNLKAVHVARQRKASMEQPERVVLSSPQAMFEDDFGDVPQIAYTAVPSKSLGGKTGRTRV